jgi:hypothetical protein
VQWSPSGTQLVSMGGSLLKLWLLNASGNVSEEPFQVVESSSDGLLWSHWSPSGRTFISGSQQRLEVRAVDANGLLSESPSQVSHHHRNVSSTIHVKATGNKHPDSRPLIWHVERAPLHTCLIITTPHPVSRIHKVRFLLSTLVLCVCSSMIYC